MRKSLLVAITLIATLQYRNRSRQFLPLIGVTTFPEAYSLDFFDERLGYGHWDWAMEIQVDRSLA